MTIEEALAVVDKYLYPQHLNHVQEIVLRTAWQGQSYRECAKTHGYTPEYIKAVGYKLWKLLSSAFGEPISKNNLQSVLRRHLSLPKLEIPDHQQSSEEQITTQSSQLTAQEAEEESLMVKTHQRWGEAVDTSIFYGRTEELMTLEQWILPDRCRLIGLFGMGGIGKTALSCKLAKQIQGEFEYLFWVSLRNALPLQELLSDLLLFLSNQQETEEANLSPTVGGRISQLIDYLRRSRCLVVLDNVDAILCSGTYAGNYRQGYQEYGELFQQVAEVEHQSILLLTSREILKEVDLLEGKKLPIRSLQLHGLKEEQVKSIFISKGCCVNWKNKLKVLINECEGNPLMIKAFASTINRLFDNSFSSHIDYGKDFLTIIPEIKQILDYHWLRLSKLEKLIMYWIAGSQKTISLQEIQNQYQLIYRKEGLEVIESIISLTRRFLIIKTSLGFRPINLFKTYINIKMSSCNFLDK